MQRQHEEAVKEINQAMAVHIKVSTELVGKNVKNKSNYKDRCLQQKDLQFPRLNNFRKGIGLGNIVIFKVEVQ